MKILAGLTIRLWESGKTGKIIVIVLALASMGACLDLFGVSTTTEELTRHPTTVVKATEMPAQRPTGEPQPTNTSRSELTDTSGPLATIPPTDTPSSQPTDTPEATNTPEPTDEPAPTETPKFGYTEEERKTIYREVVRAEDRAQNEAEYYYPTPDPLSEGYSEEALEEALESQMDYYDEHAREYKAKVAQEYGLTKDQLQEIVVEGTEKEWPLLPPPTPISD